MHTSRRFPKVQLSQITPRRVEEKKAADAAANVGRRRARIPPPLQAKELEYIKLDSSDESEDGDEDLQRALLLSKLHHARR